MTTGTSNYERDQKSGYALAEEIYNKSSVKVNAIGCLGLLALIAMAKFVSGTVLFWAFVIYYVGSIVSAVIIQNKQVEEIGGGRPGLKGVYWRYAMRRRLRILGFLGTLIFGIFFRFILPAVGEGMKDAHGRWDD